MSEKHLATGAALPDLKPGVLRVYSMRFCPYAQRTRLVLAHKKIPVETVNCDLKNKPAWLLEKNPFGLVPVLEIDDKIIYESLITADWLDEVYPGNKLTPSDSFVKAQQRILIDNFGRVTTPFYKMARAVNDEERAAARETLFSALDFYEKNLTAKFFGGEQPMMVDLMVWPWFERLNVFSAKVGLLADRFPKLTKWVKDTLEVPAVKETLISDELHAKFVQGYKSGKVVYDFEE